MRDSYDLIVIGAGAGGMTAAVVAASERLSVLLLEKSGFVGGTTAISGGVVWVPDSHLMRAAGIPDSREAARTYLAAAVPRASARAKIEAYLEQAPAAIRYLGERTQVRLRPVAHYPDYYPGLAGATLGGRALEPEPFDGARLGPAFGLLRPPLPEYTILGGMMVPRADIPHFRRFATSPRSALRVARLVLRHLMERARYPRGTSLVLGNALVGRLLLSVRELGVDLELNAAVEELLAEQGRCVGIRVTSAGGPRVVRARRGVVVATGGFSHDPQLRARLMPATADEVSATSSGAAGDGVRLAMHIGAALGEPGDDPAFWVPVSSYTAADGRRVVYPHTVTDRAKPGVIAVDMTGHRFVNEAVSYHEFVRAMLRSANGAARRAHLICDSRFLWRYGLGAVMPFTLRLQAFERAGYLERADDLATLADRIGVERDVLVATVQRFNAAAATGEDPEFGRGGDAYQRHLGDGDHRPNPCVAPIVAPPFFAIEVRPGDLGTAAGLATDASARVLAEDGAPIAGLFAVGNDASSIMQGNYPGPGITLGPALTFGYAAAKAAAAGL